MNEALWALTVLLIYLVPFFALGWLIKHGVARWMGSRGLSLSDAPGHVGRAGGGRGKRFLLGAWYND